MNPLPRLYAIADASFGDPVGMARQFFDAGARFVQLRNKAASSGRLFEQAMAIVSSAPEGAMVIVNDRPDVARLASAHGVHLGQMDLPPSSARRVVGTSSIVGQSTHSLAEAVAADCEPLNYVAVGPIFETRTKSNTAPTIGLDRLAAICESVDTPIVAIGGIRLSNVSDVLKAGAASVAVVSDLMAEGRVSERVRSFLRIVEP